MAVYRKRRTYRRKKTAWYNKKYSAKTLAIKALKSTRYMRGLINSERMYLDNTLTLSARNQIFGLTAIAQGDASNNRTGNSVLLRSIYLRGRFEINSSVASNTRITCLLVVDKQQVADTTPSISDIVTTDTDPDTLLNRNTAGRFKVLWRKNYTLTPASGGRPNIELVKYWKLYKHIRYNGTASTDLQKNGYYFVIITSESTNFPTVIINARTGYHDN